MADNHELMQALLGEGSRQANIWHCDTTSQCLNVSLQTISIPEDKALHARIRKIIASIDEKIKSDTVLSNEEKGFLEMTSLPVMKFLLVLNSTNSSNAAVDIESYAALIAQDLLSHYLRTLLQEASLVARGSQLNDDLTKSLTRRIEHAQFLVASIEPQVSKKLMEKLALIQHVAGIEKQVSATFGEGLS